MSLQKSKLNNLQKSLYDYTKSKARSLEGDRSDELRKYEIAHESMSKRDFQITQTSDLLERLYLSTFILVGDFHSFSQSSRNLERLLRELNENGKKLAIGIEFISHTNQQVIDAFLHGHITELEFLESIDYQNSWRFPWHYYKKFFDFAKEKKLKVIGLNSEGSLSKRDELAADLATSFIKANPDFSLFLFFGELHIVEDKLPRKIKQKSDGLTMTIIHQNLDDVFWKINNLNNKDIIVRFNEEEFSLQTSPPWTKYESIIYWYEHLLEDPEFEIHEFLMESGLAFNSTVPDTFVYLTNQLAETLRFDIQSFDIEDFNIYDHQKIEFIEKRLGSLNESYKSFYCNILIHNRLFKIPFSSDYYCSSYSVNRIAFLSGLHLQAIAMKEELESFEKCFKQSKINKFYFFFKQMVMAYFCSKILNPYRKCDHFEDIKTKLHDSFNSPSINQNVLLASLKILSSRTTDDLIGEIESSLVDLTELEIYYTARICGYSLGDLFYEQHYLKNIGTYGDILNVLTRHQDEQVHQDLNMLFTQIIPKSGPFGIRKRLF